MKRIVCAILTVFMIIGMCACGRAFYNSAKESAESTVSDSSEATADHIGSDTGVSDSADSGYTTDISGTENTDTAEDVTTEHSETETESDSVSETDAAEDTTAKQTKPKDAEPKTTEKETSAPPTTEETTTAPAQTEDDTTDSDTETDGVSDTETDSDTGSDTEPDITEPDVTEPVEPDPDPYDRVNDPDYFKDALFIGDSRTVGFYLYARISDAKYFGATSMSVFNVMTRKPETPKSSDTLESYLKKNKFGKVYIMLGINEIGYAYSNIVNKYKTLIETVRELQPDAIILIQSNMHVTKKKSDSSPNAFNNTRIDTLNAKLSQLADGKKIFYLDFASIFDDETGALNPDYTGDGIHLKRKYYTLWRDWIKEHGKR